MKISLLATSLLFLCTTILGAEDPIARKARRIHDRIFTLDTHCDTPLLMLRSGWDPGQRHEPYGAKSGKQDFPRMKEAGLDASFFAVFVPQGDLTLEGRARARQQAERILDLLDVTFQKNSLLAQRALRPEEAYRLEKQGKRAIFLSLENGYPIGTDLSAVDYFYQRGIRTITLAHSANNDLCDSSTDSHRQADRGLSEFGRRVVARMNDLGMMIDVSHISEKSFFDVLAASRAPVMASHSSVRALCDHPRNLNDAQLDALRKNRGVIQICIFSRYVRSDPSPQAPANIARAVDHIDYAVRRIGIDHVGIGTDFDGGGGLEDCRDVTDLPKITEELVRRGYSTDAIRKIWGANAMRVMKESMRLARKGK